MNFDGGDGRLASEAEVEPHVVGAGVATRGRHFAFLDSVAGRDEDQGARAITAAFFAHELHEHGRTGILRFVVKQLGRRVDVVDEYVDAAVIVIVARRRAAARVRRQSEPLLQPEPSPTVVQENVVGLGVSALRHELIHLGVDVAVGDEQVECAIGVEVDEARPPREGKARPTSSFVMTEMASFAT